MTRYWIYQPQDTKYENAQRMKMIKKQKELSPSNNQAYVKENEIQLSEMKTL